MAVPHLPGKRRAPSVVSAGQALERRAAAGLAVPEWVVSIECASALDAGLSAGDLVVCAGAVRDDGTSHHYLDDDEPAVPSLLLTNALERHLVAAGHRARRGRTWTTDAPYRETLHEVLHLRKRGVLCVDMEAAAVFAVASVRGIEAGAAFVIADAVTGEPSQPYFTRLATQRGLAALVDAAIKSL